MPISPLLLQVAAAFCAPLLLKGACLSLDAEAGTALCSEHAALLEGVPDPASYRILKQGLEHGVGEDGKEYWEAWAAESPHFQRTVALCREQAARFSQRAAWREVVRTLLPAVLGVCAAAAADRELENAVFRDIAISATTCCRPGCTNLAGGRECEVPLSTCGACGEARFCFRCGAWGLMRLGDSILGKHVEWRCCALLPSRQATPCSLGDGPALLSQGCC